MVFKQDDTSKEIYIIIDGEIEVKLILSLLSLLSYRELYKLNVIMEY